MKINVCLEWENVGTLDDGLSAAFFKSLARQLGESTMRQDHEVRLAVIHDETVDGAELARTLEGWLLQDASRLEVDIVRAPDTPYYEKKGLAAFVLEGDVFAFADSDCLYSEDWLAQLCVPLVAGQADMVKGETIAMESPDLMERASAYAWFFSTAAEADLRIQRQKNPFRANNFAALASVMRQVPIPRMSGSRNRGGLWIRNLNKNGVRVLSEPSAIARHKQFDSFSALISRAWLAGADRDSSHFLRYPSRSKRMTMALGAYYFQMLRFLRRFFTVAVHHEAAHRLPAIFLIGIAYALSAATGQLAHAMRKTGVVMKGSYSELVPGATVMPLAGTP